MPTSPSRRNSHPKRWPRRPPRASQRRQQPARFRGRPDQPTNASIEAAARAAGLEYAFLPVASNYQSPEEIARFAELIGTMPKPILVFCRSGARSSRLWQAAKSR
jgi:uncharacterized protein (TIGR01244 family)